MEQLLVPILNLTQKYIKLEDYLMAYIMNYKDDNGNWIEIPVMQGNQGPAGPAGTGIVDFGSKVSGTTKQWYIKFSSGDMIVWSEQYISSTLNTAWGSLYTSPDIYGEPFPVSFKEVPCIFWSTRNISSGTIIEQYSRNNSNDLASTTKPGLINLVRPSSQSSVTGTLCYFAIGKY